MSEWLGLLSRDGPAVQSCGNRVELFFEGDDTFREVRLKRRSSTCTRKCICFSLIRWVEVRVFRPVAPWRKRSGILGRNHRKNLIVDGRVAYTGGMNLDSVWSRSNKGGRGLAGHSSLHQKSEGSSLRSVFQRDLAKSGRNFSHRDGGVSEG